MVALRRHPVVGLLLILVLCAGQAPALEFHVAADGDDANAGTRPAPFATLEKARDAVRALKQDSGIPEGGITVWIHPGNYAHAQTLVLGPEDSGQEGRPIVYRGSVAGRVIFDGNQTIRSATWRSVVGDMLARLNPQARGQVLHTRIEDPALASQLSNPGLRLTLGGRMLQLARFPNIGFCHVDKILDKGAVYMHGRTLGARPTYNREKPIGGVFTLVEMPLGDWAAEFQRVQKAEISGFLAYDWYRQSHRIASIQDGAIRLLEYSRYGLLDRHKMPRRLVVRNLLCELDQPGEWYFDQDAGVLFLWPFEGTDPSRDLGYWSGPAFAHLNNVSHVVIRDLVIQSLGSGGSMIQVSGGTSNLVAGCTLRNSNLQGVLLREGRGNGLQGCDLYDLGAHLSLEGGDVRRLNAVGNFARNNHFTQVESADLPGGIRIRGVGQVFQNNLVHNLKGQPITVGGNDHLVEANEIFNVGIEEGDGGALYAGAEMWSYGNVFRHNFLHHLMCVPQSHPRGGIYPDDLNAGDTIEGNLFYKAAHRAVLLNGGAAHTVRHNVFVQGYYGVYNTEAWTRKILEARAKYDSGELKRGDKDDHLWRVERVVGKEGWNRSPWKEKYPLFAKVMNQGDRLYYPIENAITNNLFTGNHQNTAYRFTWGDKTLVPMDGIEHIDTRNNRDIPLESFRDPSVLDFRFKPGRRPSGFPEIPVGRIGLVKGPYRKNIPNQAAYRKAVQSHWAGRRSFDDKARYDPGTVNEVIYFNTGRLVMQSSP